MVDIKDRGIPIKYLLNEPPQGYWTSLSSKNWGQLYLLALLISIVFFGLFITYFQGTRFMALGIFYMLILFGGIMQWSFEWLDKDAPGAYIDYGNLREIVIGAILGFPVGIAFLFVMQHVAVVGFEVVNVGAGASGTKAALAFLGTVLFIPIAEEVAFSSIGIPTLSGLTGALPGVLVVSFVWVMWHIGVYQHAHIVLLLLFAFRFVTGFMTLYFRSAYGGLVAHIVVNLGSVLFL